MEFKHILSLAVFAAVFAVEKLNEWLHERGKSRLASTLHEEGTYTLHDLARINFLQKSTFDGQERSQINEISELALQWLELIAWLDRRGLSDVLPVLKENGATSFHDMRGWSEARWDVIRESQDSPSVKLKVKKLADILLSEEQTTVSEPDGVVLGVIRFLVTGKC
ncbi:uncharacterized protein LOC134197932 [Corticium candelabrum]|uniref:uncharacterized protein LOC134197932 n=1 Tax=Corticium candelabrum TaxID=121492 RepID=UPI002E2747B1|nr:uncharacterized protein LOC134197932 [Corticium candelabrum]